MLSIFFYKNLDNILYMYIMGNHDNLILKIFINKTGNFNSNKTRKINKYPNIKEYLDNRYILVICVATQLN